ncbi:MAG TPA: hypothetical protein PLX97_14420 [Gemmatales bacterium]|nr:hypothetical protein [Gemmatales bacterium]
MKTSAHAIAIRCSAKSRIAARAEKLGTLVRQSYLSMLQLPRLRSIPASVTGSLFASFTGIACDGGKHDDQGQRYQGTSMRMHWRHDGDSRNPGNRVIRNVMPAQETLSQTLALA